MRTLCACLVVLGLGLAARATDEPALEGDLAKLQGKWKGMVGRDMNIPLLLTIKGKTVNIKVTRPNDEDFEMKGEIKIDDKKTPKEWDWTKFMGPEGQEVPDNLAIYELDGDTLKLCSGGPGNPRPTEFKDGDDGPPRMVKLTRAKDDAR